MYLIDSVRKSQTSPLEIRDISSLQSFARDRLDGHDLWVLNQSHCTKVRIEIDKTWPVCACSSMRSFLLASLNTPRGPYFTSRTRRTFCHRPVFFPVGRMVRCGLRGSLVCYWNKKRSMGRLVDRDVIESSSYCAITVVGSNDLDLEYGRYLGVLLVGHVQARLGRRFHMRRQRQSASCTTDTDANLDARARSVVASSAYNSSDIRKSHSPAADASSPLSSTKHNRTYDKFWSNLRTLVTLPSMQRVGERSECANPAPVCSISSSRNLEVTWLREFFVPCRYLFVEVVERDRC
jgi:hypothetical protein